MKTREELLEYKRQYREKNKAEILRKAKEYREANKERIKKVKKEYNKNNRDKINEYFRQRKINDKLFKLSNNIRNLIKVSLKSKGVKKNTKSEKILGCTYEEFKQHIESLWEPWMNWDNYGNWNGTPTEPNTAWDIDHIIPKSKGSTEDEVIKLNHYTNLQPLCSYYNRRIKKK
jgi:hypothetical protein